MSLILNLQTWTQWDQSHYLDIATSGYRAFPCTQESGFNPGDWCGNASWFPFYPLLIRAVFHLFHCDLNPVLIGLVISNIFFLITLLYVLPLLSDDLRCGQKKGNIIFRNVFFILFPSSIFFHANYPLAIALCAAGLSLHLVYNQKPLRSIPLSFIACISYPPMLILSVPLLIYCVNIIVKSQLYKTKPCYLFNSILCVSAPCLSYLIAQLYIDLNTGVSRSFALVGEKYGHGIHNPIYALKSILIRAKELNEFSSLQTIFLTLIIVSVATIASFRFARLRMAKVYHPALFR